MMEPPGGAGSTGLGQLVGELRLVLGRMEIALGLLPDAVVWTDHEDRIQWCNSAFDRLTERPHIGILGEKFSQALPLGPADEHPAARIARGEPKGLARASFRSRLLEIEWASTRLDSEDVRVYLIRDRTETQRTREELEALKRGEDRFRLAVEAAPNAMLMVDSGGSIVLANSQTEKLFGWSREELIGRPVELLVPARFRAAHPGHRGGFNAEPRPRAMGAGRDLFGLRKDGSEFPVEIGLNPIERSEGLTLASIIDITERKKVEAEARERARLEAAQKELEAFSYSVAHDLRAPLRHINGFIEMLRKNSAGRLDDRGRSLLDKVAGASKKLSALIDELLQFSRTARAEIRRERVPLSGVVAEVVADYAEELKGRRVEWAIAELPEAVCDPAMIKLVFANLIGNALKFSRGRDPAFIEIGAAPAPPEQIVVFVRDNGAGFDMRFVDKLFGVFQRLHRMEDFEGTGIGLANVRRIVEKHGGRTWAEGETGKGAVFYFSLPAGREEAP